MSAPTNRLKAALAAGETQIGLWLNAGAPSTAAIAATIGFDWCLIDGEHGPYNPETISAQLDALDLGGTSAIVRVPAGEDWILKQVLDLGVQTVLVPMVDTAEQAAQVVRACRYAPEGTRGLGASVARVTRWGDVADYPQTANAEICVMVQTETRRAIGNLDAILEVEGIDCVFIGPFDLSADMGYLGNPGAPEVQAVITDAARRIRAAGKSAGIFHYAGGDIARYREQGFNFITAGSDVALMRTGFSAALTAAQKAGR